MRERLVKVEKAKLIRARQIDQVALNFHAEHFGDFHTKASVRFVSAMILRGGEGAHSLSLYGGGQHHSFGKNIGRGKGSGGLLPRAGTTVSRFGCTYPRAAPKAQRTNRGLGTKESPMITKYRIILAAFALTVLGVGAANAGPCNTRGKDAGSGPTPGYTGQTVGTGSADTKQHPPTDTMNRVTGEKAASSQDAQKQMQGQPTAAQEAMGAKPTAQTADQGC